MMRNRCGWLQPAHIFVLKKESLALLLLLPPVTEAFVAAAETASVAVVSLLLLCSSAVGAPLGLVLETLLLVESLFAFVENKFRVAILTG
jgi:hypothetical protein